MQKSLKPAENAIMFFEFTLCHCRSVFHHISQRGHSSLHILDISCLHLHKPWNPIILIKIKGYAIPFVYYPVLLRVAIFFKSYSFEDIYKVRVIINSYFVLEIISESFFLQMLFVGYNKCVLDLSDSYFLFFTIHKKLSKNIIFSCLYSSQTFNFLHQYVRIYL